MARRKRENGPRLMAGETLEQYYARWHELTGLPHPDLRDGPCGTDDAVWEGDVVKPSHHYSHYDRACRSDGGLVRRKRMVEDSQVFDIYSRELES